MRLGLGNTLVDNGLSNPDLLSLDLQFATDKTLTARRGPTPVFTRATTGTFVGSNGLIQSAAIDAARFDHDASYFGSSVYVTSVDAVGDGGSPLPSERVYFAGIDGNGYPEFASDMYYISFSAGQWVLDGNGGDFIAHSDDALSDEYVTDIGTGFVTVVLTLACKGLLIEEARTNIIYQSDNFSASDWNNGGARSLTVTADNTISPSGAVNADLLTVGASTQVYQVIQTAPATGSFTSGTAYTVSVFVKPNQVTRVSIWTGNAVTMPMDAIFNLTGAGSVVLTTFGTASIQQYPNGWYRCVITGTAGATATTSLRISPASGVSRTYIGNSTDSFWAWGAQLEAGSFATSYIPTTTTTLQRTADLCSITGTDFNKVYNEPEHTLFAEATGISHVGFPSYLSFDNSTANEQSALAGYTSSNRVGCIENDGGSTTASVLINVTLGQNNKMAAAMKLNSFQASLNGALGTEDTGGTMATATSLKIGRNWQSVVLSGTYKQVKVFRKRLPNAKLQAITA